MSDIYIFYKSVESFYAQRKVNICVKYLRAVSTTWFLNTHYLFALFACIYQTSITTLGNPIAQPLNEWVLFGFSIGTCRHHPHQHILCMHFIVFSTLNMRQTDPNVQINQQKSYKLISIFDVNFENWNIVPHHTRWARYIYLHTSIVIIKMLEYHSVLVNYRTIRLS